MSEFLFFRILLFASLITALGIFVALFFVSAPYGRHTRSGWGPGLPNWLGWMLMESISAIAFILLFYMGEAPRSPVTLVFLLLWEVHYVQRAFIYPFLMRSRRKTMPLAIPLMAAVFNLGNAYINGRYLFHFSAGRYTADWLHDPRFIIGLLLFAAGFIINRRADRRLHRLRQRGEVGYSIPYGGLYRCISCPNYFGEILEWAGWAIATWSLPGLAFALWTAANLAPRARSHHRWYHDHFPDYPAERKALIPGLW